MRIIWQSKDPHKIGHGKDCAFFVKINVLPEIICGHSSFAPSFRAWA
jgi:hypothetical protein